MHFYFDITLQFLIMKKDLKLHFYLLYIHVYFIYTCIQISSLVCVPSQFYWQKSYIHQRSEHIFLKQVSINICKTLDWVVCLSEFPPLPTPFFSSVTLDKPELSEQFRSPLQIRFYIKITLLLSPEKIQFIPPVLFYQRCQRAHPPFDRN